jgi:uncharacterized membrane protein
MEKKIKKWAFGIIIVLAVLMIISVAIGIFTSVSYLEAMRIVYGSVYVLFLPGFILSYIFFPKTRPYEEDKENREKGAIDWIERIALSFALSIAIVPLAVFYLNLIGVKINLLNSFLTILGIIIVGAFFLLRRARKLRYLR